MSTITSDTILALAEAALVAKGTPLTGKYAVDGKRYMLDAPTSPNSKWRGWIFLSTGSDYHDRKKLLCRRPDGSYTDNTTDRGREVFAAICAHPVQCMAEYGRITGRCARCGRVLEDPTSVAIGIGPVCLEKLL